MDADFMLICRMKNGDEQAIDAFVRKYYPSIFRYCRLHINDPGYAEDMTQETFFRFFRTLNQYQHYGKALNYLYVIAGNACKDHHRKSDGLSPEALSPDYLPADHFAEKLAVRLDIHTAMQRLPEELREVTILYFFQDIRQKEIARILGIGLPLVKYRIKRAKELLAVYLA